MSIVLRRLKLDGGLEGDISIDPQYELLDCCELRDLTLVVNRATGSVATNSVFLNVNLLLNPQEPVNPQFFHCVFRGGNAEATDRRFFQSCAFLPNEEASSRSEADGPKWKRVLDTSLPVGTPVEAGTTLFTFDNYPGHWEYDLPPLPSRSEGK